MVEPNEAGRARRPIPSGGANDGDGDPDGYDDSSGMISPVEQRQRSPVSWKKWLVFTLALVFIGGLVGIQFLDVSQEFWRSVFEWFETTDGSIVLLGGLYVIMVLAFIPGKPLLALFAGYVHGLYIGLLLIYTGSIVAATIAYAIGQLFRERIMAFVRVQISKRWGHKRYDVLMLLLHREAFTSTCVIRASPFPRELSNYFLAVSPVPFRTFLAGTALVLLASDVVIAVIIGSTTSSLDNIVTGSANPSNWLSYGIAGGLTLLSLLLAYHLYRKGKRMMSEFSSEESDQQMSL